jgi:hypothetical protein
LGGAQRAQAETSAQFKIDWRIRDSLKRDKKDLISEKTNRGRTT